MTSGLLLLATAPAWAFEESTKTATLQRYQAAKAYYEQKQYPKAAEEFQLALETLPLPVLALWAARCHALSGNVVASQAAYLEAIRLTPNELWLGDKQQLAQSEASREFAQLKQHIAKVEVSPPSRKLVRVAEPPVRELPRAESSPWRTVGWVSLSAGGAALAFGSMAGLMLGNRHDNMEPDCPQGTCDPATITKDQVDEHNQLRTVTSVGLVTGGLLGAVGLTLILATPTRESKPEVALRITPSGPVLAGAF